MRRTVRRNSADVSALVTRVSVANSRIAADSDSGITIFTSAEVSM